MRQNIKDFVCIVSNTLPILTPVYEFGSFQVPGQIGFADLRPIFPNKDYVGCDMRMGPGVDKVLNLHSIDLPSESVGTVLCFDTLEHVEYPRKALEEIFRILRPEGIAVISSVMNYPIHEHPYDYWRFTPEAFKSILKPFSNSFVGFQGEDSFPHTVVGIGFKDNKPLMDQFLRQYNIWKNNDKMQNGFISKFTAPIRMPILVRVYRSAARFVKRTIAIF